MQRVQASVFGFDFHVASDKTGTTPKWTTTPSGIWQRRLEKRIWFHSEFMAIRVLHNAWLQHSPNQAPIAVLSWICIRHFAARREWGGQWDSKVLIIRRCVCATFSTRAPVGYEAEL